MMRRHGDADMKRTKYDELYEKLTQVNDIYDGENYVIEDYVNYFGNVDIQAKGDIRDSDEEAEQDVTTGGYDNGIADGAGKESADDNHQHRLSHRGKQTIFHSLSFSSL